MKSTLLFFVLMAFATGAFCQKTYIWKGGKPGRASDWNCPANWSTYRVPDEFSDVRIPKNLTGMKDYPVINSSGFEVNTLRIECGARVTITEKGTLTILNPDYCDDLSRIVAFGKIILPGRSDNGQESTLALRMQH